MPKPTFLQTVLRKPTRSYADPNAPSPYADVPERAYQYAPPSSRYSARVDNGVHLGFRDYAYDDGHAQPAPKARKARSVVSEAIQEEPYNASRFPKARKAQSTVGLREAAAGRPASAASGTVKRKKKKTVDAESVISRNAGQGRRQQEWRPEEEEEEPETPQRRPAARQREVSNSSSSAASSSLRPRSPVRNASPLGPDAPCGQRSKGNAVQKIVAGGAAPPTPPSSEPSSSRSSRERMDSAAKSMGDMHLGDDRIARSDTVKSARTIRQQPMRTYTPEEEQGDEADVLARGAAVPAPIIVEPEKETTPLDQEIPMFNIQPPTPAPFPDPGETPFHKEQYPHSPYQLGAAYESPSKHAASPAAQRDVREEDHEGDMGSEHGEAGSEEDSESSPHSSTSANNQPRSRPPSVAYTAPLLGSEAHSRRSVSRHSSRNSVVGYGEHRRQGSYPMSEASNGGRGAREGSIRSSGSGFGRGGWAVAAASTASASGNTPQMFLPSGPNSGWGEFHVPVPPPRQSRFTPLPSASLPPSFDRLLNGTRTPGGSVASGNGSVRYSGLDERALSAPLPRKSESQPSSYSQDSGSESDSSEDDGLPQPSRSYAQQVQDEYENGERSVDEGRSSRYANGPLIPRKDPRRNSMSPQTQYAPGFPSNGLQRGALSRSGHSEYSGEYDEPQTYDDSPPYSRPPSRSASVMSRALSPSGTMRPGSTGAFPRPAFLDPDVITILPEMTVEDSERLYRAPSPSETDAASRRRSFKAMSAIGRSKTPGQAGDAQSIRRPASSVGFRRDDEELERGSRRAKSVMGFRGGDRGEGSKWEGSSYGDGVLMQSDGLGESRAGSYNTMILPAGAFVPSDPNRKRTSMIDPRVLGLPHTTMATLCLSHSAHRLPMTPVHLRGNLPPPVDFTSHIRPPSKVGNREILVQVYAVAVDGLDIRTVEEKGKGEVGKWVPGRSFVGRCLGVGTEEKEIVRGELVVGLLNVRKSGALAEYIACDRRHLSRAPHPTTLTLEQLALLPLFGIPATRAVRGNLTRGARALIMDPHEGVSALICQEMSRAGVNVTALIGGGDAHHDAQTRCLQNGARGVLTGAPAAVMLGLDEEGWDVVVDTKGTQRVYDAARRMLKDGGKIISLAGADPSLSAPPASKPSGFKTLRQAFSRRKNSKYIHFTHVLPAGSGEAEVDTSGMDVRDVLDEPRMAGFRPVLDEERVWAFERGMEAFRLTKGHEGAEGAEGAERGTGAGVGVVRIIN